MNLLIVEDNQKMRELIRGVLADLADSIHECSDGSQALELYERHRPDWVLMDIKLGEIDGIEATRLIKASFPEAKIVIVTNYDDPTLREAAQQAGACEYVLKESLLEVRRILGAWETSKTEEP